MDKTVHIVCHDIPYPVTHGGFFDLYNTVRLLHAKGVKVLLHCFYTDRQPSVELENICERVYYYKRKFAVPLRLPYIVSSRKSKQLIKRLQADDYPVLLEGMHCTYPLYKGILKNKTVLVRLHNTEQIYYAHLAENEQRCWRRLYFKNEARLLEKYEALIAQKAIMIGVSRKDCMYFRDRLHAKTVEHLNVLLPFEKVTHSEGVGNYCLYHGNLSINENIVAVKSLVEDYFSKFNTTLVVAGYAPDQELKDLLAIYKNIRLIDSPSDEEMEELIRNAQINILPSVNATGVKLKILHALFSGRHCLTNLQAVEQTPEEQLCHLYDSPQTLLQQINKLLFVPLSDEEASTREKILLENYNPENNINKLSAWLFRHYPTPSRPPF